MTAPADLEALLAEAEISAKWQVKTFDPKTADLIRRLAACLRTLREDGIGEGGPTVEHPSSPPNGDPEGWRLIESAPRDGTWFLVAWSLADRSGWVFGVVRWLDGEWMEGDQVVGEPDRWFPLPEPPASGSPLEGEDVVSLPHGMTQNPSPPPPQREG